MDLVQEQRLLERDCIDRGARRYFEALEAATKRDREFEGSPTSNIIRDPLHKLEESIRKLQKSARASLVRAQTTGQRLGGWEMEVLALDSKALAFITFKCVLVAGRDAHRVQRAGATVGRMVNYEVRWEQLREAEAKAAKAREYDPPNRIAMLKRQVTEINPRSLRPWLKKLDDVQTEEWTKRTHFVLGTALLNAMLEACPDIIEKKTVHLQRLGSRLDTTTISLCPEFRELIKGAHGREAVNCPWLLPMICPPRPWIFTDEGTVDGGYLAFTKLGNVAGNPGTLIKEFRYKHTQVDKSTVSPELLEALNRVQSTPWKINQVVLARASTAVEHRVGPVPFEPAMDMPRNVNAETWAKMSKTERGKIKSQREAVHTHNNRNEAKALTARRVLNVAEEFAGRDVLYFPHSIDWRGRAYPLPQDLHPQADDFAKSMLTFAEGKPLGETGLQWLAFHMANCFGMDKVDRQGQADWVNENQAEIFDVASDPFGIGLEFWKQADEPWQFLAAAIEYCSAWSHPVSPEYYISHLPVQVDGSCNGLQHLSAMGLDPVGAKAVNLMPGPRQDIYQIVADKVVAAISKDAHSTSPKDWVCSHAWEGNVTRKTVKRGVMTTPYGLTPIGMRDQLISDRWVDGLEGDRMENANYLRDKMQEAIDSTIVKGTEIMAWFQDCAEILAEAGKGVSWTTPIGLRVTQHYTPFRGKRTTTLLGRFIFDGPPNRDGVMPRKQKLSIAPNIIHSFDAAHMMLSVLAAPEGYSFSVIHDSFGCHAADMEEFGHVIREQFVDIYKTNWFAVFTKDFASQRGEGSMTPAPVRGDFDIDQVLDAEFFFA
jgi:DNA-directed RNA polymerase